MYLIITGLSFPIIEPVQILYSLVQFIPFPGFAHGVRSHTQHSPFPKHYLVLVALYSFQPAGDVVQHSGRVDLVISQDVYVVVLTKQCTFF